MFSELQKHQDKLSEAEMTAATQASVKATKHYNRCYDNEAFKAAVAGKSTTYANAVIDDALALSGCPFYQMSRRRYCAETRHFLAAFERPGGAL